MSASNLYEQTGPRTKEFDKRHTNYSDSDLLKLIEKVVKERPTYGYRRVTAILNRDFRRESRPRINHKRVYRIMRENDLLWKPAKQKATRTHNGKVIVPQSDSRYCSDTFEIWCWDNKIVRVAFVLDCCDREVITWIATTAGINGAMIRDLMAEVVENRFGSVSQVPHRIEWLSDNGSIYRAHKTRQFAKMVGLDPCTTPVYSPESNGMAESFVKTFKRDYVRVNDLTSAVDVLEKLHDWFEDYNENHPHKGLRMKSPREFRQLQQV